MTITTGCGAWPVIALPTTGLASHQLVAVMTSPHVKQRLVEHGIYLITKVRTTAQPSAQLCRQALAAQTAPYPAQLYPTAS